MPCSHNQMVKNNDPNYAWKCASCGYVYGKFQTPRVNLHFNGWIKGIPVTSLYQRDNPNPVNVTQLSEQEIANKLNSKEFQVDFVEIFNAKQDELDQWDDWDVEIYDVHSTQQQNIDANLNFDLGLQAKYVGLQIEQNLLKQYPLAFQNGYNYKQ